MRSLALDMSSPPQSPCLEWKVGSCIYQFFTFLHEVHAVVFEEIRGRRGQEKEGCCEGGKAGQQWAKEEGGSMMARKKFDVSFQEGSIVFARNG